MRASVDTTALATTTSSLAKAEALYTSKTVTVQVTNGCWLALLPVRTEPVGSVVVAKAVAARLDNGSDAAVLDVWKAN